MNISKDEAQLSLEAIQQVQKDVRRSLARGGGPIYMMLWGAIWFLGYLGEHFLQPALAGKLWMALVAVGFVLSFVIGWRTSTKIRVPGYGPRIALFWLAWIFYTSLIIALFHIPTQPEQMGLFIALMAMFGYVVMGLWIWSFLAWVGILVTVIIVLASTLMPEYTNLIMAILGGGTLGLSGLYIYRSGR
ncbi:MAG TPA: hypothetical protein ENK60_04250 [Anaerolineae bacterium]|nr:hypothetical protein [Anaerolineae bacterium]